MLKDRNQNLDKNLFDRKKTPKKDISFGNSSAEFTTISPGAPSSGAPVSSSRYDKKIFGKIKGV